MSAKYSLFPLWKNSCGQLARSWFLTLRTGRDAFIFVIYMSFFPQTVPSVNMHWISYKWFYVTCVMIESCHLAREHFSWLIWVDVAFGELCLSKIITSELSACTWQVRKLVISFGDLTGRVRPFLSPSMGQYANRGWKRNLGQYKWNNPGYGVCRRWRNQLTNNRTKKPAGSITLKFRSQISLKSQVGLNHKGARHKRAAKCTNPNLRGLWIRGTQYRCTGHDKSAPAT